MFGVVVGIGGWCLELVDWPYTSSLVVLSVDLRGYCLAFVLELKSLDGLLFVNGRGAEL